MVQVARVMLVVLMTSLIGFGEEAVEPTIRDAICGAWSRTHKLADGTHVSIIKIITSTHFAVFQQDAAGVRRDLFQAHSGRYTVEEGLMTESYMFSSDPKAIGKAAQCRVTIAGDALRQTWTLGDGAIAVEVWHREQIPPMQGITKP